jgi:hypothetical protein
MLFVMLVVVLVVVLFILPPQHAPIQDIHNGALNECLGIVYIPIKVLCGVVAKDYLPRTMGQEKRRMGWVMEIEHNT